MRQIWKNALIASAVAMMAQMSWGSSLGLMTTSPDIYSNSPMTITFTGGHFSATTPVDLGNPFNDNFMSIDTGGMFLGGFDLEADIDSTGHLTNGTITIDSYFMATGNMISGNLTDFGFSGFQQSGNGTFEFKFDVTGGFLAASYGSTTGGVIITSVDTEYKNDNSLFAGDFARDFYNTDSGNDGSGASYSDTFPVAAAPTPAVFSGGLGLLVLRLYRRRRSA